MSDINNEIIDYLKLEKQVRLDGLEMMDKSAEIPQRLLKEVSIFDRWIEHLANGANASDSGLHLQRVSNNEVAVCNCGLKGKMVFNEVTQELYCECGKRIKVTN